MNLEDRLVDADYAADPHGAWVRTDDVYETVVTTDDAPGLWMVAVYNTEPDAPDEPARFRVRADGTVADVVVGIDRTVAEMIVRDLQ